MRILAVAWYCAKRFEQLHSWICIRFENWYSVAAGDRGFWIYLQRKSFTIIVAKSHSFFKPFCWWQLFSSGQNILKWRTTQFNSFQKHNAVRIADTRFNNCTKVSLVSWDGALSRLSELNRKQDMVAMDENVHKSVRILQVRCFKSEVAPFMLGTQHCFEPELFQDFDHLLRRMR